MASQRAAAAVQPDQGTDAATVKVESQPRQLQEANGSEQESESQAPVSHAIAAQPAESTSASSRSRPAGRTVTTSTRGKPAIAAPKFAGRRSQAARAELEKEAARKKAEQAEAAAAEAKRKRREQNRDGSGGRGARGGRGRGGFMGDHQSRHSEAVMSGPFGSGQISHDSSSRRSGGGGSGVFSGGGGGGSGGTSFGGSQGGSGGGSGVSGGGRPTSGGSGIKVEGGSAGPGGMQVLKTDDGGYISSDEDEAQGRKQNIDDLQRVIDLTVEDDQEDQSIFAPVRLKREPHKDRTIGLTAESRTATEGARRDRMTGSAPSERRKGKQREKELEVVYATERPRRPTTYSSSDETDVEHRIKTEPVDEEVEAHSQTPPAADDAPVTLRSPPSSPESKRKAKEKIKKIAKEISLDDDDEYPLPDMPKFQTQAEVDEWKRHYADLNVIRTELGRQVPKASTASMDREGDTTMNDHDSSDNPRMQKARKAEEIRSEHVYLFQFPPVLPNLAPVHVKPDPESYQDIAMGGADAPTLPSGPDGKEEASIKAANLRPKLPSGFVGKLRIHKSGKAVLDWGGTSFVLGAGTDPTFLQNILVANIPETKPGSDVPASDNKEAVGMGMGQVRGKFVLTPDWDEILR